MPPQETDPATTSAPVDPARRREARRSRYGVLGVIALGGAIGATARYGAARLWPDGTASFPWTTFTVNVVGCLVIGVFLVAVTEVWFPRRLLRPFFGTGVLGGFTTFSTWCVDIQRLVDNGRVGVAAGYLVATIVAAMVAVTTAAWSTRWIAAKWSGR